MGYSTTQDKVHLIIDNLVRFRDLNSRDRLMLLVVADTLTDGSTKLNIKNMRQLSMQTGMTENTCKASVLRLSKRGYITDFDPNQYGVKAELNLAKLAAIADFDLLPPRVSYLLPFTAAHRKVA